MIDCFEQVFDLIIIIRFISINNGTIWKLISIILQGIHIAKASRGKETFNGLPRLGNHQMNLQSVKVSFLAGLLASKLFSGVILERRIRMLSHTAIGRLSIT